MRQCRGWRPCAQTHGRTHASTPWSRQLAHQPGPSPRRHWHPATHGGISQVSRRGAPSERWRMHGAHCASPLCHVTMMLLRARRRKKALLALSSRGPQAVQLTTVQRRTEAQEVRAVRKTRVTGCVCVCSTAGSLRHERGACKSLGHCVLKCVPLPCSPNGMPVPFRCELHGSDGPGSARAAGCLGAGCV